VIILIRRNCLLFVSFWLNPLWRVYARKFENCPFSSPERISLVNRLESIFHITGINHNSAVTSPPWLSGARFTILLPEKWEGRGIIWVATLRIYIFRHVEQLVSEVCFCCVCATALLANAWRRSVIVRSSFADRTTTCSTTTVADLLIVVLPGGIVTYVLCVVVIHTGRFVFISYAGGSLLTMCTQHVFAAFTVVYCLMRRHVSAVFSSLASCCSGFWASSAFSISYLDAVRDLWEHYGGLNFY